MFACLWGFVVVANMTIYFVVYYYNVYLTLLFRERTYYLMSTAKRQHDAVNIINLRYTIVFCISNFPGCQQNTLTYICIGAL